LTNLKEKPVLINSNKFKKNSLYNSTEAISFPAIKNELKGYLNKFVILDKHYGTIIEIEIDGQQKNPKHENKSSIGSKIEKDDF
jgi:hypothetical protein